MSTLIPEYLPDGWEKLYSQSRKKYFYFNKRTGESVWTITQAEVEENEVPEKPLNPKSFRISQSNNLKVIKKLTVTKKKQKVPKGVKFRDLSSLVSTKDPVNLNSSLYKEQQTRLKAGKKEEIASALLTSQIVESFVFQLYIVVDTNVLLQHLEFIKSIPSLVLSGIKSHCITIPWIVINELDGIKDGSKSNGTNKIQARKAISYINEALNDDNHKVIGQTGMESDLSSKYFDIHVNDDLILACCLQKSEKGKAILLTEDINLKNKATISGIKTYSSSGFRRLVGIVDFQEIVSGNTESSGVTEDWKKIASISITILTKIVEVEMKICYDNLWEKVLKEKPPWTLASLIDLIYKHHWLAVFGHVFPKSLKPLMVELSKTLRDLGLNPSKSEVLKVVDILVKCLSTMVLRSKYQNELPQSIESIKEIRKRIDISYQNKSSILTIAPSAQPSSSKKSINSLQSKQSSCSGALVGNDKVHKKSSCTTTQVKNVAGKDRCPAVSSASVIEGCNQQRMVSNLRNLMKGIKRSRSGNTNVAAPDKVQKHNPSTAKEVVMATACPVLPSPINKDSPKDRSLMNEPSYTLPSSPPRSPEDQDMIQIDYVTSLETLSSGGYTSSPVKSRLDWIWGKIGKYCSLCFENLRSLGDCCSTEMLSDSPYIKFLRLLYLELYTFTSSLSDILSAVDLTNETAKVDKFVHVLATFCTRLQIPDDEEMSSDVTHCQVIRFYEKPEYRELLINGLVHLKELRGTIKPYLDKFSLFH